jgi:hypothetical protein
MATTITEILALIKAKLVALDIFGVVVDYSDGNFTKFPAAVVTEEGGTGEVLDTHRNARTFSFTIKLYQEQSEAGKTQEEAAEIMRTCSDAILTAFDKDKDLSGSVEIVRVVEFNTDFKVAAGTFNFATFRVEAVVIVPNY